MIGPARASAHRRGFTLIETLAVVAILALAAVIVLPNLAALGERRLRHAAQRLAAELELARQRAVVTGVPHRILFDLENGLYRIEWLGNADEEEMLPVAAALEYDVGQGSELPRHTDELGSGRHLGPEPRLSVDCGTRHSSPSEIGWGRIGAETGRTRP